MASTLEVIEKNVDGFLEDKGTSAAAQPELRQRMVEILEFIGKVAPQVEFKFNPHYIAIGNSKSGAVFNRVFLLSMKGYGEKKGCRLELCETKKMSFLDNVFISNIQDIEFESILKLIYAVISKIHSYDKDFYRIHFGDLFESVHDIDADLVLKEWRLMHKEEEDVGNSDEPKSSQSLEGVIGRNTIYYGPPGTGKTYQLQQLQKQFTETLAAEDLNLRYQEKLKSRTWAEVICLIFLDENRMLRVPDIIEHRFFQAKLHTLGRSENISQTAWGTLQRHAPVESTTVKYSIERRSSQALFDKDTAGLWQLLDSARADLGGLQTLLEQLNAPAQGGQIICRYNSVTFHQSYGYEDFIEGLRPVMDQESDSSQIGYEIRSGVFVELCERARHDPDHPYAMFIDEINRGNVSRIFGELISLIEPDKRAKAPNELSVILPHSRKSFSVPRNVSIYGSMNSADRSLTPLDTALRRRFEFVEVMPEPGLLGPVEGVDVPQLLGTINQRIEALIGRDHVIGHAYFLPIKALDDLRQVFLNRIIPLLAEYFFEDWSKIRLVLADHLKPAEQQMVQEVNTDAQALFGPAPVHLLPRHRINPALQQADGVFAQPDAYRAVYVWPGATG